MGWFWRQFDWVGRFKDIYDWFIVPMFAIPALNLIILKCVVLAYNFAPAVFAILAAPAIALAVWATLVVMKWMLSQKLKALSEIASAALGSADEIDAVFSRNHLLGQATDMTVCAAKASAVRDAMAKAGLNCPKFKGDNLNDILPILARFFRITGTYLQSGDVKGAKSMAAKFSESVNA